ncbi:hypothetical protein CHCC20335_4550 [Bacillus paralicheniformis]|nr:hypothetical protein CHCC20335_4550 [Bacillus paralicheniformis]
MAGPHHIFLFITKSPKHIIESENKKPSYKMKCLVKPFEE